MIKRNNSTLDIPFQFLVLYEKSYMHIPCSCCNRAILSSSKFCSTFLRLVWKDVEGVDSPNAIVRVRSLFTGGESVSTVCCVSDGVVFVSGVNAAYDAFAKFSFSTRMEED